MKLAELGSESFNGGLDYYFQTRNPDGKKTRGISKGEEGSKEDQT